MEQPDRQDRVDHRGNNFDFVRLVAASLVLYSHCFALTAQGGAEPLVSATLGRYSFGGLAVRVFFVISGFLVMQSWLRRPRVVSFVCARVLRVVPGLAVALAFCVVLGGATTRLPLGDFFSRPETFDFYWRNLIFETEFYLPGVFEGNLEPRAVNGSLWTLHYEVRAYAFLLLLGVVGAYRNKWLAAIGWLAVLAFITAWPMIRGGAQSYDWPVINLFACFIAAALLALYGIRARTLGWIALFSAAALALSFRTAWSDIAMDLMLVGATLWFGQQRYPGIASAARFGDFSYGIFIYAFPVQQLVASLTGTRSPYLMLVLAFPLTLALAALSWHWVERPCLELKRLLAPRQAAKPTPTPA